MKHFGLTIMIVWGISLHPMWGQVMHSVRGQQFAPEPGAALTWTSQFLADQLYPGLLLEFESVKESPGGLHYTFSPQYQGKRLLHNRVKVNTDKTGQVVSVLSNLKPVDQVVAFPEAMLQKPPRKLQPYGVEPCFFWESGTLKPVWYARHHEVERAHYEALIWDAQDLTLLRRQDLSRYYRTDTTGRARVFIPDPCTKAGVFYGELFQDNNDAHDPVFDALMDTVELQGLSYDGDTFRLRGPYVEIADLAPLTVAPVTSTDGNFFFTRDQSGFEDVMAYYHIDRFQRYIQGLGFTNLQNRPIRVDPHGFGISDQSKFTPLGDASYLLYGEGGVDDAEDADVLIHEYAHALSYDASRYDMMACERRGLDEGIADFFAAGYSRDINPFDWENLFNWDGHNPFFDGRTVTSTVLYPLEDCNGTLIYEWGEVWSAAMMNIRNEIGAEVADRLMLQAMYSMIDDIGFVEGAQLVLEADQLLYQGAHAEWINFYFCQQGILTGSSCLSVANEQILGDPEEAFRFYPNPGTDFWTFEWQGRGAASASVQFSVMNLMGQEVARFQGAARVPWQEHIHLPNGIYVYRVEQAGNVLQVGKVGVR